MAGRAAAQLGMVKGSPRLRRILFALLCGVVLTSWLAAPAHASKKSRKRAATATAVAATGAGTAYASSRAKGNPTVDAAASLEQERSAEARLLEVHRLVAQGRMREALHQAETLARLHPNFQLAQLVYADLLTLFAPPQRSLGAAPAAAASASARLAELREEAELRLKAQRNRPPAGMVPAQFAQLSPRSRHAIAVDTSRARLYLFENSSTGMRLVADYYVSVGRLGVGKQVEGDQRTPLGVYYITGSIGKKALQEFYGAGALPINYPNPYDLRLGKTGSGIWLHGSPPNQLARTPRATDGCVVLSNADLATVLKTVETRTTPVVIARQLKWVAPQSAAQDLQGFTQALNTWRDARGRSDLSAVLQHYAPDFSSYGKKLAEWTPQLKSELARLAGNGIELKDLSMLRWTEDGETVVVTFGEVPTGRTTGPVKRQYWSRQGGQWKIFFEGVIG